jgi:hypothetical protein
MKTQHGAARTLFSPDPEMFTFRTCTKVNEFYRDFSPTAGLSARQPCCKLHAGFVHHVEMIRANTDY